MTPLHTRLEVAEWMTAEDFFRDAPENRQAELIDGVMVMPSPLLTIHKRLQSFLATLLRLYVEEQGLGEVLGSRTAVELDIDQVLEPDILFVATERASIIQAKGVVGAPDFVVEILSAGTARYDRGPKFRAYQRAGVRELWLIDPYGSAGTEFYQLQERRLTPVAPNFQGIVRASSVPGFWIQTDWLWPVDRFVLVQHALSSILAS